MTGIVRTQPTLANRKLPEFVRCPVCDVDFRRTAPRQRWCSPECSQQAKRRTADTPRRIAVLPRVQPIAPVRRTEPFDDPEWLFDFKYDGFRALCYLEQGRCRLTSRNGNLIAEAFEAMHRVAVARDQATVPLLKIAERAEAIVFEIEEPFGVIEWLRPSDRDDGLDARKQD